MDEHLVWFYKMSESERNDVIKSVYSFYFEIYKHSKDSAVDELKSQFEKQKENYEKIIENQKEKYEEVKAEFKEILGKTLSDNSRSYLDLSRELSLNFKDLNISLNNGFNKVENVYRSNVARGTLGENTVESIVKKYFPMSDVKSVAREKELADIMITTPENLNIQIEVKNYGSASAKGCSSEIKSYEERCSKLKKEGLIDGAIFVFMTNYPIPYRRLFEICDIRSDDDIVPVMYINGVFDNETNLAIGLNLLIKVVNFYKHSGNDIKEIAKYKGMIDHIYSEEVFISSLEKNNESNKMLINAHKIKLEEIKNLVIEQEQRVGIYQYKDTIINNMIIDVAVEYYKNNYETSNMTDLNSDSLLALCKKTHPSGGITKRNITSLKMGVIINVAKHKAGIV